MTCYKDEVYDKAQDLLVQVNERVLAGEYLEAEHLAWMREGILWSANELRRHTKHADDIVKAVLG